MDGFIVFFSVVISIISNLGLFEVLASILSKLTISKSSIIGLFSGLIEITNGINNLSIVGTSNLSSLLVITSFLLGFGGISVGMQVYSCISKSDLSIKPYFIGKLIHGFLSALYTFIFLYLI